MRLCIIIIVVVVEVASADESGDRADAEFPGVEAGVLDGDLLVVGFGLGADADGGDARGEGDREEAGEDEVEFYGVWLLVGDVVYISQFAAGLLSENCPTCPGCMRYNISSGVVGGIWRIKRVGHRRRELR